MVTLQFRDDAEDLGNMCEYWEDSTEGKLRKPMLKAKTSPPLHILSLLIPEKVEKCYRKRGEY